MTSRSLHAALLPVSLTEIGADMTGRIFERSQVEPLPFPLHVSGYAACTEADFGFDTQTECASGEYPTAAGCLRGFCSAIGIETAAGLIILTVWHFRHLLW